MNTLRAVSILAVVAVAVMLAQTSPDVYTINATQTTPATCCVAFHATDSAGRSGLLEVGGYYTQFDYLGTSNALYCDSGVYSVVKTPDPNSPNANAEIVTVSFDGHDLRGNLASLLAVYNAYTVTTEGICHGARGSSWSCPVTHWYTSGGTITITPM